VGGVYTVEKVREAETAVLLDASQLRVVLRKKEKLLHKNAASNKIHCLNISLWG
jgi:hypothetical protein